VAEASLKWAGQTPFPSNSAWEWLAWWSVTAGQSRWGTDGAIADIGVIF